MSIYKANEQAVLTVKGEEFKDWTSVWVQRTWGNAYDQFKFSCAERDGATAGEVAASSKFKPGDKCEVKLAGELAITGEIISRQTAYDANSRGVQLQGTSRTWPFATSSVVHKTNRFDGKTFKEIVKEVLEPTGAPEPEWRGEISDKKFKYAHSEKGETNFALFDRLAKNRNILVSCNKDGKFLFVGKAGKGKPQGQLIEGENILKMQCVESNEQAFRQFIIHGNVNADNGLKYRKASEQEEKGDGLYEGDYRTKLVPMEQTGAEEGAVRTRLNTEQMWEIGSQLNATIVVYGWQPSGSGDLWIPGGDVTVHSPMARLKNQTLMIQSVTYTQDNNSGTTTTLVCVSPAALNGPRQFAKTS